MIPALMPKNKVDQADDDGILAPTFFERPAEKVAHDLIGWSIALQKR